MNPVLALRGMSFSYAGASAPALRDLTLRVDRGEVVAVAGPAGAGATTLLLVAADFAPRLVAGSLSGERAIRASRPAIVFATPWTQLTGLCETVRAEVAFGPAAHGWARDRVLDLADRALASLGVAHLSGRDPATLSGGELQRVIVASAVALEPDLLVLDDPAAELDPRGADELYELLAGLGRGGTTVFVATPDWERAARASSRALWLEAGRLLRDGQPSEVLP